MQAKGAEEAAATAQQYAEVIAAQPADTVPVADMGLQHIGEMHQHGIARI